MNLKHFFYAVASLIFVIALSSCNSDNEFLIPSEQSPEGRIIGFSVSATPFTSMDTLTYPALPTTKFAVENRGVYQIVNLDSLPMHTDIRSLKVALEYASGIHTRTDLVYPKDSIVEWNETDSVKFIRTKELYYPQFKVVAPSGYERTYTVSFNIHKQDPDSIKWLRVKNNNINFDLKEKGETQVILSADKSQFIAFTNNQSKVNIYTSPVESPAWTAVSQSGAILPANTLVKSLHATNNSYVIIASDGQNGVAYSSPIGSTLTWTEHNQINIQSIVGLLPEVPATKSAPLNEFLITYLDNTNTLVYAKTSDFNEISEVKLTSRNDNKVIDGFPVKNYSSLQRTTNSENFLIVSGGVDSKNEALKKSWIIKNISLANETESKPAEISIYPGATSHIVPFTTQVTSFLYNDMIYAISSDSLSLYNSQTADTWKKADKKQKLDKSMADMNLPSVVVDKENYIWVFGGVSNDKTNPTYSQQIWRGRINKLGHKN